ncbi:MAG: hypothetical protein JEZ06_08135 [Anaerolineaceae bacterium]|nr:hypothetical protein [Anaerolineaceae bacterium]
MNTFTRVAHLKGKPVPKKKNTPAEQIRPEAQLASTHELLRLQRTHGNFFVQQLIQIGRASKKPTYIAHTVLQRKAVGSNPTIKMRTGAPSVQRSIFGKQTDAFLVKLKTLYKKFKRKKGRRKKVRKLGSFEIYMNNLLLEKFIGQDEPLKKEIKEWKFSLFYVNNEYKENKKKYNKAKKKYRKMLRRKKPDILEIIKKNNIDKSVI